MILPWEAVGKALLGRSQSIRPYWQPISETANMGRINLPLNSVSARVATIVVLIILPVGGAHAEVTFFGSVSPDPPGDGNVESSLTIGLEGDDNSDLLGYVQIDGGSQIEYDSLVVGKDEGYHGELIVSGSLAPGGQSRLVLEEGGSTSAPTVQIGREGVGRLSIAGGGSMILQDIVADLTLGVESSGVGFMTVRGPLSMAVIPDTHIVGDRGIGRLEILDGGVLQNTDMNNTTIIGATAGSVGEVVVDGAGSLWKINDNLTLGASGTGALIVSNQAMIDVDQAGAVTTVGAHGRLELADGIFSGTLIALDGILSGSGLVRGELTGSVDSLMDISAGGHLHFADGVSNQGVLQIREGDATFLADFSNLAAGSGVAPGRIALESGRVRFSQPLANDGVLALTTGSNHLHGAINNGADGTIVIASDAVGTFYDTVNIGAGMLELLAGANGLFLSDFRFETNALLRLHVDEGPGGFSQVHIGGAASLAGGLEIELVGSNSPTSGDSFALLSASGGVTGTFDAVSLPDLDPGLLWKLNYGENQVVLEVQTIDPADFDTDGDVDGDDFAQWKDDFGKSGADADADADGDSDGADFLAWQRQFGSGSGSVAISRAVPEPSSGLLLATLTLLSLVPRYETDRA